MGAGQPRPVGLSAPGSLANSALWFLIVAVFGLTMILAPSETVGRSVDASMVLLLFTNSTSFLIGLVIPSPVHRR